MTLSIQATLSAADREKEVELWMRPLDEEEEEGEEGATDQAAEGAGEHQAVVLRSIQKFAEEMNTHG